MSSFSFIARSGVFLLLLLLLADGPTRRPAGICFDASSSGPSLKEPEEMEELGVLGRVEAPPAPEGAGRGAGGDGEEEEEGNCEICEISCEKEQARRLQKSLSSASCCLSPPKA